MKRISFLLILISQLLSSCSTGSYAVKMIKDPRKNHSSKYGPSDGKKDNTGLLCYYNQMFNDSRRELSYKNMHNACDGSYKIVEEGVKDAGGGTMLISGNMATSSGSYTQYCYKFECTKKK